MATIIPRQMTATVVVAATDSSEPWRASWDDTLGRYLQCDGTADDVEINAALAALPATGGTVILLDGTYTLTAQITRAIDNITIIGQGINTILNYDGLTAVITASTQDGWLVANLSTDAGGVDIASATNSSLHNVWLGGSMVTIANPDAGQTTFPGQEILRLREVRHPDPTAAEDISVKHRMEFLEIPTFGVGVYQMLTWNNETNATTAFNVTEYYPLNTADLANAVEADAEVLMARTGRLARLTIKITANTLDGAAVFTVRINGADSAIVMSIAAGVTGTFQSPLTDTVSAKDTVTVELDTTAATTNSITVKLISLEVQ